jgi:cytochrome c
LPYFDYDFASDTPGAAFDCQNLVNESPHNTGLRALPAVVEPLLSYTYGAEPLFPELDAGGVGPMAGPAYVYDEQNPSPTKWPQELDGLPLFYEWTRDLVREFHLDAAGNLESIGSLLNAVYVDNPIDMEFGPDGSLYVLEYGDGYFRANPDARLSRIDFVRSSSAPMLEQ